LNQSIGDPEKREFDQEDGGKGLKGTSTRENYSGNSSGGKNNLREKKTELEKRGGKYLSGGETPEEGVLP